jgi:hypothetical protein
MTSGRNPPYYVQVIFEFARLLKAITSTGKV